MKKIRNVSGEERTVRMPDGSDRYVAKGAYIEVPEDAVQSYVQQGQGEEWTPTGGTVWAEASTKKGDN